MISGGQTRITARGPTWGAMPAGVSGVNVSGMSKSSLGSCGKSSPTKRANGCAIGSQVASRSARVRRGCESTVALPAIARATRRRRCTLCHGLARLARVAVREVSREVEIKTGEAESIRPLTSPTAPWPQERNAFHWLIGVELVGIFERHFGRRAAPGRSHNDYTGETGEANSPYIRFAHAVLADLGIKSNRGKLYSRETIARELTRIKTGAPARRKPKYERV